MTTLRQPARTLRLVGRPATPPGWSDARPAALFALDGCREGGDDPEVRASAFVTLVEGLWEHETLELVIGLDRTGLGPPQVHIGLQQSLASAAGQTRDLLPGALAGALPRWQLAALPLEQWPKLPELRAVLRPASLISGTPGDSTPSWLPMPKKLPSWGLTTPFDEPLAAAPLMLRYRFRSARMTPHMRQLLHRRLLELRRGGLRLHPAGGARPALLARHPARRRGPGIVACAAAGRGWLDVRRGGAMRGRP